MAVEEPEGLDENEETMVAEQNCKLRELVPQNQMDRHARLLDNQGLDEIKGDADNPSPEIEDNDEEVEIIGLSKNSWKQ